MDKHKKENIRIKIRTLVSIIELLILFGIVIAVPVYVYFTQPELIARFQSLDEINQLLTQYKTASIFIYIGLQIIQIVISILPGQALQFAAGYAYSYVFGFLYSMVGVILGTAITFYLARILGKRALHVIFGEEKFGRFVTTLNSKRAFFLLFIIYLIPGIPKDLFAYAAGVSEMKIVPFLIISILGRTPAMIGSVAMGRMFYHGSYEGLIILGTIAAILFVVGIFKRERLLAWTDKLYQRFADRYL